MLQKNYPTPKKTCCFAQVNLVLKTEALQCTVWWLLALHFGFQAQDENKKLKWATLFFKQTTKWERTLGTVFPNTDLPSGE